METILVRVEGSTAGVPEEIAKLTAEIGWVESIAASAPTSTIGSGPADGRAQSRTVTRTARAPMRPDGLITVDLGRRAAGTPISLRLLTAEGVTTIEYEVEKDKDGVLQVLVSKADRALIQRRAEPHVPPKLEPATRPSAVRLVAMDRSERWFDGARLFVARIDPTKDWARLDLGRLFRSNEPITSSIELPPEGWSQAALVAWMQAEVGADGRALVPLPSQTADERRASWIWLLEGPRSAVGVVLAPRTPETPSSTTLLMLPPQPSLGVVRPSAHASTRSGGDCRCRGTSGGERPTSEAECAENPSIFTEDPGAFCRPFSNPERVLGETIFTVLLRATQPEISPVPSDELRFDPDWLPRRDDRGLAADRPQDRVQVPGLGLRAAVLDDGRGIIDPKHPVQWESEIVRYQAASVSLGHMLEFRVRWRSNGYSLGSVAGSLTLAPRQTKRVQTIEWSRREEARRSESQRHEDRVADSIVREREYADEVRANLDEWNAGGSVAGLGGVAGGIGGFLGKAVVGVGAAAGVAGAASYARGGRVARAREEQRLRDEIRRYGESLRRMQATVVTEVGQSESAVGVTETIRNINYGRSLTVVYYDILRHLRVDTELAGVRECLFVPLAISPFTIARAHRWRDPIRARLRDPRFARGLDHLRDVGDGFANSNVPDGRRADAPVRSLRGSIFVRLAIPRPRDVADADFNPDLWGRIVPFSSVPAHAMHAALGRVHDSRRDEYFATRFGNAIAANWCSTLRLKANGEDLNADFTMASTYGYRQVVRVDFTVPEESLTGLSRGDLASFLVLATGAFDPGAQADLVRMSLTYATDDFEHTETASNGAQDLIDVETGAVEPEGAKIQIPLSTWERVHQRNEMRAAVDELLDHLNAHIEYYHKCIWWAMDRDRLFMLLDGFYVPGTDGLSIASVVEREPIGIVGNSIVYRVAAGRHLGTTAAPTPETLFDLYADGSPKSDPLLVSLPTAGVYAQTIMDPCESIEEHFGTRDWVLNDPDPELGSIDAALLGTRRADPSGAPAPTALPATIINLQNAPDAPAPSGVQTILGTVGTANAFRDAAGLAATQANALGALQSAAGLATSFGQHGAAIAAAELASKVHATSSADRKLATIRRARDEGLIDEAEASTQAKGVLNEMHAPAASARPLEDPAIVHAIDAASRRSGSTIRATTGEGEVAVSLGEGAPTSVEIERALPWMLEGSMLLANFAVGEAELQPEQKTALLDFASFVAARTAGGARLRVRELVGHASNTGSEDPTTSGFAGNLALSRARAEQVRDFLETTCGLRPAELPADVVPSGSSDPVVPTLFGVEHPLNRSVRMRFQLLDRVRAAAADGSTRWKIDLSVSMANSSSTIAPLLTARDLPASVGLRVGGMVDFGTLESLNGPRRERRSISILSAYMGIGAGVSIPAKYFDLFPDGARANRAIAMGTESLLAIVNTAGSQPSIDTGGRFKTARPIDIEDFDGMPVVMLQFGISALFNGSGTIIGFIDPFREPHLVGWAAFAGLAVSPLSVDASATLHVGCLRLSSTPTI